MKNHYVSQFIIKRFSNEINIFDIKNKKIFENKKPDKVFYKKDKYDEELEKLMNYNIESKVAKILDSKILVDGDVILTREELWLLKRYMLICSVRTMDEKGLVKILRGFKETTNMYINIYKNFFPEYDMLPSLDSLELSDEEIYLRVLKVFSKTTYMQDIASDSNATREMLVWAMPFIESYIAFWDAPEDKEFILTDCGMCTEYEGFHQYTDGLSVSKKSYLTHMMEKGDIEYKNALLNPLASIIPMYENYNIFNLSSKRSMIMINPFFRLYYEMRVYAGKEKIITLEKPDIWPAVIQDKKLFAVPKVMYIYSELFGTTEDKFIYAPKVLSNYDLVYINNILLSNVHNIIGFNDVTKIIDSIGYHIWYVGRTSTLQKPSETYEQLMIRANHNLQSSPYLVLYKYCENKGGRNGIDFECFFNLNIYNIFKDFNENPYICEYALSRPEETIACKQLDFLGKGEEKLNVFRKKYEEIMQARKNANKTF